MKEEAMKYLKIYKGEEECPKEYIDTNKGPLWGGEQVVHDSWDALLKQKEEAGNDTPLDIQVPIWVMSVVAKFDPFSFYDDMAEYCGDNKALLDTLVSIYVG